MEIIVSTTVNGVRNGRGKGGDSVCCMDEGVKLKMKFQKAQKRFIGRKELEKEKDGKGINGGKRKLRG